MDRKFNAMLREIEKKDPENLSQSEIAVVMAQGTMYTMKRLDDELKSQVQACLQKLADETATHQTKFKIMSEIVHGQTGKSCISRLNAIERQMDAMQNVITDQNGTERGWVARADEHLAQTMANIEEHATSLQRYAKESGETNTRTRAAVARAGDAMGRVDHLLRAIKSGYAQLKTIRNDIDGALRKNEAKDAEQAARRNEDHEATQTALQQSVQVMEETRVQMAEGRRECLDRQIENRELRIHQDGMELRNAQDSEWKQENQQRVDELDVRVATTERRLQEYEYTTRIKQQEAEEEEAQRMEAERHRMNEIARQVAKREIRIGNLGTGEQVLQLLAQDQIDHGDRQ